MISSEYSVDYTHIKSPFKIGMEKDPGMEDLDRIGGIRLEEDKHEAVHPIVDDRNVKMEALSWADMKVARLTTQAEKEIRLRDVEGQVKDQQQALKTERQGCKEEMKALNDELKATKDRELRKKLKERATELMNKQKVYLDQKKEELNQRKLELNQLESDLREDKKEVRVKEKEIKSQLEATIKDQKHLREFKKRMMRRIKGLPETISQTCIRKNSRRGSRSQIPSELQATSDGFSIEESNSDEERKEPPAKSEDFIISQHKFIMQQYRELIMFGQGDNIQIEIPKEIQHKQTNIRNMLGLNQGNYNYEANLSKTLKIVDLINSQFLFVFDPENEYFNIATGKKLTEQDLKVDSCCYFNSESRECVHCVEEYEKDEVLMKLNTCGHVFHAECAEEAMFYSNACPLCRQDIYNL